MRSVLIRMTDGDILGSALKAFHELLFEGDSIYRMMQVTGEEGISIEDYVKWQKSVLLDMVYLQQDAFDKVDADAKRRAPLNCISHLLGQIPYKEMDWKPPEVGKRRRKKAGTPQQLTFKHEVPRIY